jgi:hypothetical protein
MQKFEFSNEEVEVLREVLQHGITEIDVEVFRTDTHEFKEMLKRRRTVLEQIFSKLSAVPVNAVAA